MTYSKQHPSPVAAELATTDSLMFFIDGVDELISTFKDIAETGANLTVGQITEELLPPDDLSQCDLRGHCNTLAVSMAILLQRVVTG